MRLYTTRTLRLVHLCTSRIVPSLSLRNLPPFPVSSCALSAGACSLLWHPSLTGIKHKGCFTNFKSVFSFRRSLNIFWLSAMICSIFFILTIHSGSPWSPKPGVPLRLLIFDWELAPMSAVLAFLICSFSHSAILAASLAVISSRSKAYLNILASS